MTSQFGNKIISSFEAPTREDLQGRNLQGVPIQFILISTEVEFFDSTVETTRRDRGFAIGALDSTPDRATEVRFGFAHFWGQDPPASMGLLRSEERRRIVIVNGVKNSPRHRQFEVLFNEIPQTDGSLSGMDEFTIKAAIDSVEPGAPEEDFDQDGEPDSTDPDDDNDGLSDVDEVLLGLNPRAADSDHNGISDGDEDPDHDGFTNRQEVVLLRTNPFDASSRFAIALHRSESGLSISFPTLPDRQYIVEAGSNLQEFSAIRTIHGHGAVHNLALGLDTDSRFFRVRVVAAE